MRYAWMLAIGLALVVGSTAQAAEQKPAPGELPAGHPDISKMMPAGHPKVPGMPATTQPSDDLPPGHPQLPAGHPAINSAKRPTTGPAATAGKLTVHLRQGTKGGPALAGQKVLVDLYHNDQVLKHIEAETDANGALVLDNLPILLPVQPLVRVLRGGVQYQRGGEMMDGYNAEQTITVPVYESTDQAPPWRIQSRQVMVAMADGGLRIIDMMVVSNPTDRTWLGVAQPEGRRTTISLPLPAGIKDFESPDGSDQAFVKSADKLTCIVPLTPGNSRMAFTYVVPAQSGKASVVLPIGRETAQMIVFVQEGGKVSIEGLKAAPAHNMGDAKALIFSGTSLKEGQQVKVSVDLPAAKPASAKK